MSTTDMTNGQERVALRQNRGLSLIPEAEEGSGIAAARPGTYGFTYAPGTETPVFARTGYDAFEVHKLTRDEVHVIGYIKPEEFAGIESGSIREFQLFPAPFRDATKLVSIDMGRISKQKTPRTEGNPVVLTMY